MKTVLQRLDQTDERLDLQTGGARHVRPKGDDV